MQISAFQLKCEDIAWAAGFWEGEGSLTISLNGKGYYECRVTATQKVRDPLDKLLALFGGLIYKKTSGVHQWNINKDSAGEFLRTIVPYIVTVRRKEEIESFCRFLSCKSDEERARLFVQWQRRRK